LTGARADQYLLDHRCHINHDWQGIPPTPVPTRDVQDGHSFAVMLAGHRTDVEGAVTSAPLQVARSSHERCPRCQNVSSEQPDEEPSANDDSPEQADSEPFAFATDDDVMEGVQVYSLHRSQRHFFVRWTTFC